MKKVSTKSLVFTALSIAIVTVCTMVIKIQVPATQGYVNFGDIMIFAVAITLGKKKGAIAGGLGSCIADILLAAAIYAPATLIIKGIEGFLCGLIYETLNKKANTTASTVIACTVAGLFMVLGYFVYETILYGIVGASAGIVPNLIQAGVSVAAAIPVSIIFKKATKNIIENYAA